ncbi:MAG: NAD(P)-binding domain-containing protein [Patescibacteria group bacterium]
MIEHIAVIGAGRIGNAFARIFKKKGYTVELWDKEEGKVRGQKSLFEVVSSADIIFLCVPSWALREVCGLIKSAVRSGVYVISTAKGIERETLKTPDEIIDEFFVKKEFGMLGGPMLAEEIDLDHVGIGVIGSAHEDVYKAVHTVFHGTPVHILYSKDVHGVAIGGILKNVYALAFGIADGLKWSGNAKGWFLVKSMNEIARLARTFGGRKKTILDVAGLGDLATCGFSEYSRNRKAGQDVLEDGKFDIKSEGVVSAPSIFILAGRKVKKFEILFALKEIIDEKKDPRIVFQNLLEKI